MHHPVTSDRIGRLAPFLLILAHMLFFDRGLGGDGWTTFAFTESLVVDGDPWLENNERGVRNGMIPVDGHLVMQYPPAVSLLDVLPYSVARAVDALLPGSRTFAIPPVGEIPRATFFAVALIVLCRNAAVLVGLFLLRLAMLRLDIPERVANLAVVISFFGSPLIFYSLVGMTHAVSFMIASGILVSLLDPSPRFRGLAVGSATLVRYASLALAAPILLHSRRAIFGLAAPLALLPFWWKWETGSWMPPDYGGGFELTLTAPFRILVSPHHGFFLFHPLMLLGVVGLLLNRSRLATLGMVWVIAVAALNGSWSEWANEGGFGQRFMIDAVPPIALGLAWFLEKLSAWRVTLVALLALFSFLLFFLAVAGFATGPGELRWPQTLSDYRDASSLDLLEGLRRASFFL